MKISVIICTYKNPDLLRECLQSVAIQSLPVSEYEILVVDNKSNDETPEVVQSFAKQYKNIRYIFESNQGLSHARNRGIREAAADIIAFTDDDAIIDKHWLESLISVFEQSLDIWAVGGKTLPLWRTERPDWLDDTLLLSLSIREYGDNIRELVWPERMIGVNCSFRKDIFKIIGYFDTSLGRKGNILFDQEDIEIQKRILAANKKIFYTPHAIVQHIITSQRTNPDYFMKRTEGSFRTNSILDFRRNKLRFFQQTFHHLLKLPAASLSYRFDQLNKSKQKDFIVHKAYVHQAYQILNPFIKIDDNPSDWET
jgi:glycosyltransferase involved in cell wall biosynthesis